MPLQQKMLHRHAEHLLEKTGTSGRSSGSLTPFRTSSYSSSLKRAEVFDKHEIHRK